MAKIALDLDGTIADTEAEIVRRLKLAGIKNVSDKVPAFKVENAYPELGENWIIDQMQDATFWLNQKPYKEAWYWVNDQFSKGNDIYIITRRRRKEAAWTERWLEDWDIIYNDIYYEMPLGAKGEYVKMLEADFLVDDRYEEVIACEKMNVPCYLLDKTYNKGEVLRRIRSLYDIKDFNVY